MYACAHEAKGVSQLSFPQGLFILFIEIVSFLALELLRRITVLLGSTMDLLSLSINFGFFVGSQVPS